MHWPNLNRKRLAATLVPLLMLAPASSALAHVFGSTYTPPVPVLYYQAGAATTLLISFLVAAWLLRSPNQRWLEAQRTLSPSGFPNIYRVLRFALQLFGLALLLLAMVSGFLGHPNPYLNFSMTGFWVVFVLGFFYAHVLFGNLLEPLNPWRALCTCMATLLPVVFARTPQWPARAGYLPALVLYIAFIWFELYGAGAPVNTARLLLAYTVITFSGCALWGTRAWLRYGEFFSVLFRLVSHLAPLAIVRGKLILRWPLTGLLQARTDGTTHLLFILFVLASTAFDGLQSMISWLEMTWEFLRDLLRQPITANPAGSVELLKLAFRIYHAIALILAPLWYFVIYALAIDLARRISGSSHALRTWLQHFAMSLVPVAVVYHAAHYYTLLQVQGLKALPLASDPLGRGWNLFGTQHWFNQPVYPDPPTVWNMQVTLILVGHLLGVLVAHLAALRLEAGNVSRTRIIASQGPLLVLMMGLTVFGLWILAQPSAASG